MVFICFPYTNLNTEEEIIEFCKQNPDDSILWNDYIFKIDSNGIINKTKREDPEKYTSIVNIDNVVESCIGKIIIFQSLNNNINKDNTKFISLFPGSKIILSREPTSTYNPSLFSLSNKKTGSYFDLVIYIVDNQDNITNILTYNNKDYKNIIKHSGDIHNDGYLLQTICGIENLRDNETIIICAVGYNCTPLHKYKTQVPAVSLFSNNKVYIIPCSLEPIVVGNNNLITIAIIKNNILYTPTEPGVIENINVGDTTKLGLLQILKNTIDNCKKINNISEISLPNTTCEIEKKPKQITQTDNQYKILHIIQKNILTDDIDNALKLEIDQYPFSHKVSSGSISIFALKLFLEDWETICNCSSAIIHLMPNNWITTTRVMKVSYLLNGLYILHFTESIDKTTELINSKKLLINWMNNITNNFLSIVGPQSVIVVKLENKYFWYDGVCINILLKTIPLFGDDVTEFVLNYTQYIQTNIITSDSTWINYDDYKFDWEEEITHIFTNILKIHTEKYELERMFELSNDTNISKKDIYNSHKKQIEHLDNQLSNLETNFREIIFKMQILSEDLIINAKAFILKYCKNMLYEYNLLSYNIDDSKDINKIKDLKSFNKKIITNISSMVSLLFSRSNASSKSFSIKSQERKEIIKKNVQDAINMSKEEYAEYLQENASEGCLNLIIKDTFFQKVIEGNNLSITDIDTLNSLTFDNITASCIIEIAPTPDTLFGLSNIIVPTNNKLDTAVIMIPINSYATKYFDEISWSIIQNEPQFSYFRILLRNLLASIRTSPFEGKASSPELTSYLINNWLNICEYLINRISVDSIIIFEDTLPTIIRGIMGHMFATCASGSKPFSEIYNIVYKNKIINFNIKEWMWIIRITLILKKINYDKNKFEIIISNLKKSFFRFISRMFLKILENCQKLIKSIKNDYIQDHIKKINEELQWLKLVTKIFILNKEDLIDNEIIKRLLHYVPNRNDTDDSTIIFCKRNLIMYIKEDNIIKKNNFIFTIKKVILNVINKRSGYMTKFKNKSIKNETDFEAYHKNEKHILNSVLTDLNLKDKIDDIKLQNSQLLDISTFMNGLKGDAECKRIPWAISFDEDSIISNEELEKKISFIMGIEIDNPSSNSSIPNKDITSTVTKIEDEFIIELLKTNPSDELVNYITKLNKIINPYDKLVFIQKETSTINYITKELFDTICSILEIDNIEEFINFSIKTIFLNWTDQSKAIEEIYLKYN